MVIQTQQFIVNPSGEITVEFRRHRAHQGDSFSLPNQSWVSQRFDSSSDCPEAGHGSYPNSIPQSDPCDVAIARTSEVLDRRYRNYLQREGSAREIFNYYMGC